MGRVFPSSQSPSASVGTRPIYISQIRQEKGVKTLAGTTDALVPLGSGLAILTHDLALTNFLHSPWRIQIMCRKSDGM